MMILGGHKEFRSVGLQVLIFLHRGLRVLGSKVFVFLHE